MSEHASLSFSTRILAIGDIHLQEKNYSTLLPVFEDILRKVVTNKVTHVVLLGDTLHTNERISLQCLHIASSFILRLSELCHVIVLIGNHDMLNNQQYQQHLSPFTGLEKTNNVTIVWQPILITPSVLAIPYLPKGRLEEALHPWSIQLQEKNIKVVLAHQEFRGCQMGAVKSLDGDEWRFPSYVISGHIHEEQKLGRVYYPGALEHGNCCLITLDDNIDGKVFLKRISVLATHLEHVLVYSLDDLITTLQSGNKKKNRVYILTVDETEAGSIEKSSTLSLLKQQYPDIPIRIKKSKRTNKIRKIEKEIVSVNKKDFDTTILEALQESNEESLSILYRHLIA